MSRHTFFAEYPPHLLSGLPLNRGWAGFSVSVSLTGSDIYDVYLKNLAYAIPEPGTLALVGIVLGALLVFRRRKG